MRSLRDIPQMTRQPSYHVNTDMQYVFEAVGRYVEEYGCQLDPDFQRGHVWNEKKQIDYIEFVLQGGQLSKEFKFNMPRWMGWKQSDFNNWTDETCMVLVDGKQRLESVRLWLADELPAFGHTLNEYTDHSFMNRIWFDIYINDLPDRKSVLNWYLEINTGGVIHTEAEINKVKKMLAKFD